MPWAQRAVVAASLVLLVVCGVVIGYELRALTTSVVCVQGRTAC